MISRPSLLVPVVAIVALLATVPIAAAAGPKARPAQIEFDLPANHGLQAHLSTFNREVTLEIERKGESASYDVKGEATEAGLKARFGKLGLIDVAFEATETHEEKPPKGCKGPASAIAQGDFVGTIDFSGERNYVRIETGQVKGTSEVDREQEWRCPGLLRARSGAGKEATFSVVNRRCDCSFIASAESGHKRGPVFISGAESDHREGMEITRVTSTFAGGSAFDFDHAAGTATLCPPPPFSGRGTFERRPHGPDLWRSTIRVPLLGAAPLHVGGPGFRARLVRGIPPDR